MDYGNPISVVAGTLEHRGAPEPEHIMMPYGECIPAKCREYRPISGLNWPLVPLSVNPANCTVSILETSFVGETRKDSQLELHRSN